MMTEIADERGGLVCVVVIQTFDRTRDVVVFPEEIPFCSL